MKYRYVVRRSEWMNTDNDWRQFVDYVRDRFSHVVVPTEEIIYFNATPEQLRQAVNALRISTTSFDIITTSKLEPSTHE